MYTFIKIGDTFTTDDKYSYELKEEVYEVMWNYKVEITD